MARGLWGLSLLLLSSGEGAGGAAGAGAGGNADPAGGGAGTGGGAPAKPAAPAGDVEVKGHTVPKHVMDEQKRAAKTAQKAADDYKAAAEAATAARATAETQLGTLQAQLAFARVGVVDDEHVDAVMVAYGKLPAEGKPASAVEYWQQLQAGTATAPRSLLGFMPAAPAAPAVGAAAPPVAPPRPALPAASASPPPAGAAVTVDMVVAAQSAFAANKSEENRKRMNDLTAALKALHQKKP